MIAGLSDEAKKFSAALSGRKARPLSNGIEVGEPLLRLAGVVVDHCLAELRDTKTVGSAGTSDLRQIFSNGHDEFLKCLIVAVAPSERLTGVTQASVISRGEVFEATVADVSKVGAQFFGR